MLEQRTEVRRQLGGPQPCPATALQTNQLRDPEAFAVDGGAQAFASHLPLYQTVPATLP